MKLSSFTLLMLGIFSFLSQPALAQAPAVVTSCNTCHGPDGVSQLNTVPTIAGISGLVLEDALYAYRQGDRECPMVAHASGSGGAPGMDMCVHANGLAEEDVAGVADYYAALPFVPADQETDAAKAALGKVIHDRDCEICHTQGGSDPADDASILAGQHMGYLRHALMEYQASARPQPRPMEAKATPLSAADIDALVHFYGSQQ